MRIVKRSEWAARPPKSTPTKVALSARTASCTHHDGADPIIIRSFAEACARVRADQNYHMDSDRLVKGGANDIGYNFLVISAPGVAGVDGLIFEGRGRDVIGAHCLNHNTEWLGIQVAIGGDQVPSPAALVSVRWLHDSFEVAAGRQLGRKVHSDGFATACPGPFLKAWVHSGMQVRATPPGPAAPIRPPVKPAPKPFPLPAGHWFGMRSPNPRNHSGANPTDRPGIKAIQSKVGVLPDGDYGANTRAHVMRWQTAHHLPADGAAGVLTWNTLNR